MSATEPRWYELRNAVLARDFKAAEALLRQHPGLLALRNSIGETVLHHLAVENHAEGVAWLHGKGADLDTRSEYGNPVLFEVAQLGYEELFAWFADRGADLGAVDGYGQSLIAFLAEHRRFAMARTVLRIEFEAAFAGVARDPEQSLHQAQLADQGMSRQIHGQEWREAGRRDREKDWTEVSGEALDECDAALSHLTPASWRFYLPAYLCRSLSNRKMLHAVLFQLTCPDEDGLKAYLLKRFESLTPGQRGAVRHFLELVLHESEAEANDHWQTYDHAKTALESYWGEKRMKEEVGHGRRAHRNVSE